MGMCGKGRGGIGKDRSVPVLDAKILALDVCTASATKTRRARAGDEMTPLSLLVVPSRARVRILLLHIVL